MVLFLRKLRENKIEQFRIVFTLRSHTMKLKGIDR